MKTLLQRWMRWLGTLSVSIGRSIAKFGRRVKEIFRGVIAWFIKQYQIIIVERLRAIRSGTNRPQDLEPPGEVDTPTEVSDALPETPVIKPIPGSVVDPKSPAAGHGVWIWRMVQAEDGHLQQIIEKAKLAGLDWVAIKAANGTSHWVQFNPEVIRKIREVGIKVFGWVYAYGNNPQNEAEVAKGVLRLGCDGLIIDAEREYEGKALAAERYMQLIRAAYPDAFIAYSSFPIISKHPAFPYIEFGKYSNATMPQCYWKLLRYTPEAMIERLCDEWGTWEDKMNRSGLEESVVPIIPVGQGFDVDTEEVLQFMEAAKGYTGINLWEWSQISKDVWRVFTK